MKNGNDKCEKKEMLSKIKKNRKKERAKERESKLCLKINN